jgi:hypothetical protein
MPALKPGGRFRCAECSTEVIVIRPGPDGSVPHCCSREMESLSSPAAAG